MSNSKKRMTAIFIAMAVVLCMIGGTIAWMATQNRLVNQFTVGTFSEPATTPYNPDIPIDTEDPDIAEKLDGHLYEPNWEPDSMLFPDATVRKDPYVGMGTGSEDAYVYVKVANSFDENVGFTINSGWSAVEGQVETEVFEDGTTMYKSGIFRYDGGIKGSVYEDSWTKTPLFSKVCVDSDATIADLNPTTEDGEVVQKMEVRSFLHQMMDGEGNALSVTDIVEPAAIATLNAAYPENEH